MIPDSTEIKMTDSQVFDLAISAIQFLKGRVAFDANMARNGAHTPHGDHCLKLHRQYIFSMERLQQIKTTMKMSKDANNEQETQTPDLS